MVEEAGLETEGMAETTSQLRAKLLALTDGKVDIMLDDDTFKNTTQILREMAAEWENLTDVEQAAALELLGGKRQANTLSAILANFDIVEDAIKASENSAGSALAENEKYLDSIQGRIDLFNNAVQTMWNNTLDSDLVKGFVDLGTELVKIIDKVGLLNSALLAFGAFKGGKALFKAFSDAGINIQFLTKSLWSYITGVQATTTAEKALTQAQLMKKLTNQGILEDNAKAIIVQTGLGVSTDKLTQSTLEAALAELGYSEAQQKSIASQVLGTTVKSKDVAMNLLLRNSLIKSIYTEEMAARVKEANRIREIKLVAAKAALALAEEQYAEGLITSTALQSAKNAVDAASVPITTAQITATELLSLSLKKLALNFLAVLKVIAPFLVAAVAIWAVTKAVDALTTTTEELKEKYDELNSALDETKSKLSDIDSQLEDVNSRIKELTSQGTLSFTEQEELERLRAQSAELQRQKDLYEGIKDQQQIQMNESALDMAKNYEDTGTITGKTTQELTATGGKGGAVVGGIIGAIAGTVIPGLGTIIGTAIGIGIGTAIGAAGGHFVGENEPKVGDSLDNMRAEYSKLQQEYQEAQANYLDKSSNTNKKKLEKAEAAFNEYKSAMVGHIQELDSYYSQIDWATATEEQRQEIQDFYDTQDQWAIQSGGANAKTNALNRIFGEHASDEIKKIKEEIEAAMKAGEDFDFGSAFDEDFKQRLYDMGLTVAEVKYYFLDLKKAEEEAADLSTYDVVKQVANLTDGVNSLIEAFGEFNEMGIVTAKTLVELQETFGHLGSKWDNFVSVMTSGVASTEEAKEVINELAESLLVSALASGEIGTEQYVALWSQLVNLGVTNAKELLDAIKDYSSIGEEIANEVIKGEKTIDEAIAEYEENHDVALTEDQKRIATATAEAKQAKQVADEYEQRQQTFEALSQEYEKAKEVADELEDVENEAEDTKSGKFLFITYKTSQDLADEAAATANSDAADEAKAQVKQQIKSLYEEIFGESHSLIPMSADQMMDEIEDYFADPQNYRELSDETQARLDELSEELGLNVKLKFESSSKLVDDIQSVFDTLVNAQKEYNEEGYLSVDTLQGLLELEPKYLALLYDENGNLNLNKETLYQVAIARITDMKLKQQDMILSEAEKIASEGTIEKLNEQIDAMYGMSDAYDVMIAQRLDNIRTTLEERKAAGTLDSSFDVDGYISGLQGQLDAVEAAANSSINNIRNSLSSAGNTAKADEKSALEKLQEKYERKISNLDNQQTYLENEIERLEAENKGVSKSYYEDQIEIEEQKMALLQQQRTELTSLLNSTAKGTDNWWEIANALWEVEHAIQESTLRTIEFRESIAELYKTAFDELDKAYGDKDDLYSDRQAYIEKYMELLELQGKAKPASGYMGLIAEEEAKLANSMAELIGLRKVLADGMASGEIKEGDERWIEMQSSIRETEAAILDSKVAIEEYKEELKSLQVEAFDMVREAFSNRNDYYTNQQDYIEGYIDYLEATGVDATPEIYEKLIAIEKEKRANNVADLVDARAGLAKIEAAGYTAADEEWVDANNRIVELEKGIQDSDIAMAEWQKTIREMDFEKFDQFADRVNSLNEELENVYQLVEDEDVAFDDGTWTKEGITALSMLYHQIENNKKMIAKYSEELAKLEKQYKSGEISEKEYNERAEELEEQQWDLVHTNEDLKDSIIDINEARIDLVEEGINKEVDAMSELIDLKKEELEAERD